MLRAMNLTGLRAAGLLVAAALFAAAGSPAATRGAAANGAAFLEGGVGRTEIEAIEAERGKYSLWIITAVRTSGAYLADVKLRITDDRGQVVLQRQLQAPWLLIDLPLGRYEIEASYEGQVQRRTTAIHPGDHHQAVFHFDAEGDMLPASAPK